MWECPLSMNFMFAIDLWTGVLFYNSMQYNIMLILMGGLQASHCFVVLSFQWAPQRVGNSKDW